MKRKMGLGFGLFSKSNKSKSVDNFWPDDDDTDSPLEGIFVNRPPPLDPKTEHDLRKACAVILQDLKPSGYDVEDTRMRSDMLVEEGDEYDKHKAALPKSSSRSQPLVLPATKTDRDDSFLRSLDPNYQTKPSNENKRHSRQLPSTHIDSSSRLNDGRLPSRPPQLDLLASLRPPESFDSTLAPAPTAVDSANKLASPAKVRPLPEPVDTPLTTKRIDSTSTLSSSRYSNNSTNDLQATSTGFTSAHFTPDINSKRVSTQALVDTTISSRPDAATGQWMKEEAEKRRQADSAQSEGTKFSTTNASSFGKVSEAPETQTSQNYSRSITPDTQRNSQLSLTRPRSSGGQGQPIVVRDRKRIDESPAVSERSSSTVQSRRLSADPSQSQSNPKAATQGDRPLTPRTKEAVPPVPRLTQAQAEQAMNSKPTSPLSPTFPYISTQTITQSFDRLHEKASPLASPTFSTISQETLTSKERTLSDLGGRTKSITNEAAPPVPPKAARHTANGSSTSQKYQLLPIRHHDDESITVKDFWKPSLRPTVNKATSRQAVPTIDVHAMDFDRLMGYMRDTEEPMMVSGRDEPITRSSDSRSGSMLNSKQQNPPTSSHSNNNRHSPLSPTFVASLEASMNTFGSDTPIVTKLEKPSSRASSRNGVVSPNSSQAPSVHSKVEGRAPSSSRGFKRFFGRDKAVHAVWVPPPGPQYVHEEEEEDEDWYDDQACAAPVVGFGRGW